MAGGLLKKQTRALPPLNLGIDGKQKTGLQKRSAR